MINIQIEAPSQPAKPQPAAGDTADTSHLRKAKRAFCRTVVRQAKRQHEQELA